MKKTLLFAALFAAGFSANAQVDPLPNGSIAPDFTASDVVNEVEYSLYEDYLENGKSVIIDFSATWCGPCWNYHKTHALADMYEAYGPNGSDEIMVIFVEGDHVTTVGDIFGEASQAGATIGDWTIGSPYPIINDTPALNLNNDYSIGYFPTVYVICEESKETILVDQQTAVQLRNTLGGCQTLAGVANHGMINAPEAMVRVCASGEMANFSTKLKNFGNNNITGATVELRKDGVMVATTDYTGNLAQFGNATISFDDVVIETGAAYTIHLTDINGAAAFNQDLAVANVEYEVAATAEYNNIEVLVYTDNYPGEISWEIQDEAGDVVAEGGPYTPGTDDQWGGGGADANTTMSHSVNLPADGEQCYNVVFKDSFGDGWIYGSTPHGIEVYSNDVMVFQKFTGGTDFGNELENPSAFRATGVLGSEDVFAATFAMYPNPTTGILNFTTSEPVAVTVMDITGKVVFTAKEVNNGESVNLGSLQSGVYVAKVNGASGQRTEKIVIK